MADIPEAAALKLERAKHHIADLNGRIQAYAEQRPFKLVKRFDPEKGRLSIAAKPDIPVPDELACVAGDAFHNLRSALDHAYFAILSSYTERPDNLQFPVWRLGGNSKESVLGRRMIKLAPKDVRAAIEACEPYPGGRYHIHELDTVDVSDKHRLPILTGRAVGLVADVIGLIFTEARQRFVGPGILQFVGDGEDMVATELPVGHPAFKRGAFEDEVNVRPNVTVVMGDGPFKLREVVPCLTRLEGFVREAIAIVWKAAN